MTLREQFLEMNGGDIIEAASYLALTLTRDDAEAFKVGYTVANAILAAQDVFPEVTEEQIRFNNRRSGWNQS